MTIDVTIPDEIQDAFCTRHGYSGDDKAAFILQHVITAIMSQATEHIAATAGAEAAAKERERVITLQIKATATDTTNG